MGYKETADLRTRGDRSNFLVDASQIALPLIGGAAGFAIGGPAGAKIGLGLGNAGAGAIASNNYVSDGIGAAQGGINTLTGLGLGMMGNESVKAMGGNLPQVQLYNGGGTHEQNPYGGIPVDEFGNPSMNPSALVEQNEVGYKLPNDQSGYVFSDRIKYPGKKITYSDEAKRILGKYKNRLGKDLNKPDTLAKESLDKEIEQLKEKQELSKSVDQQMQQVKAYGGYLKKLAMGGPGDPVNPWNPSQQPATYRTPNPVPQPVYNFVNSLTGNVSDTTMFSPEASKLPTYDVRNIYGDQMPGMVPGTMYSTVKGGNKLNVPSASKVNSQFTSDYNTDLKVRGDITNNPIMQRAARLNATNQQLTQFLDPEFLRAGMKSRDSLINVQGGDTTGMAKVINKIATGHPKRNSVDPVAVLNKNKAGTYVNDVLATDESYKKGELKKGFKNIIPMNEVKGTNESDSTSNYLGQLQFGLRSALSTVPYAKRTVEEPNATTTDGRLLNQFQGASRNINYEAPLVYNPKDDSYTSYISKKDVKMYPGEEEYRFNTKSHIDPNNLRTYQNDDVMQKNPWVYGAGDSGTGYSGGPGGGFNSNAYGGSLARYDGNSEKTGQLPMSDRDTFLKYNSGLPESYMGYGIQAATRLPQLFTKAEKIAYDRVNPETIDLAQERANMQTSRNAQLGFLKRQASMAGSAGQALNYLGSAVPSAYNQYDQGYNQSIERESNANAQILNQANAQNAQIQMKEAEANAMERDAARGIRDQAMADLGKIGLGAMTAKGNALQQYNQMRLVGAINDYGINWTKDGPEIHRHGYGEAPTTPTEQQLLQKTSNDAAGNMLLQQYMNSLNQQQPQYVTPEMSDGTEINIQACGGSIKKCKGGYLKKKGKK